MVFCCLRRCALVLALAFDFFDTPALARSFRTESRGMIVSSARGSEVNDLSTLRLGEAARRAARECIDLAIIHRDVSIKHTFSRSPFAETYVSLWPFCVYDTRDEK
jgi:hypothetical protein